MADNIYDLNISVKEATHGDGRKYLGHYFLEGLVFSNPIFGGDTINLGKIDGEDFCVQVEFPEHTPKRKSPSEDSRSVLNASIDIVHFLTPGALFLNYATNEVRTQNFEKLDGCLKEYGAKRFDAKGK